MFKSLSLGVFIFTLGLQSALAETPKNCANLTGTWQGSCYASSTEGRSQIWHLMELEQTTCENITLDGETIPLNGVEVKMPELTMSGEWNSENSFSFLISMGIEDKAQTLTILHTVTLLQDGTLQFNVESEGTKNGTTETYTLSCDGLKKIK